MSKAKKSTGRTIITMILFGAVIIVAFVFVLNREKNRKPPAKETEVEKLLHQDLEKNYPETPREVIKLYARITKSFYENDINDDTLKALIDQQRLLYDDELLIENPLEKSIIDLKNEIKDYAEKGKVLFSYEVDSNKLVEYETMGDREYAIIRASFVMWEKGKKIDIYEKFLMRQDSYNNWKILGWELDKPSD